MLESLAGQAGRRPSVVFPIVSGAVHAAVVVMALRAPAAPGPLSGVTHHPVIPWLAPVASGRPGSTGGGGSGAPVPGPVRSPGPLPGDVPETLPSDISLPGPSRFLPAGPPAPWGVGDSGLAGVQVFRQDSLTDLPEPRVPIRPRYPGGLRLAGLGGDVEVSYVVGVGGRVEPGSVRVIGGGRTELIEAVQDALYEAEFRPGRTVAGVVPVRVRQRFHFAVR